jgi:regulator of protease activity HflC (stomatin/prohibitin superfamily)
MNKFSQTKLPAIGVILFSVIILALFIVPFFFISIVDAGHIGVKSTFGNVSDTTLKPGINFKGPFDRVIQLSTRTEEYTMSSTTNEGVKEGDDSIQARAKDGAAVYLDVTVLYNLNSDDAPSVYRELGVDYESKVIRPAIRSAIREVAAQYSVNEIYSTKRDEVTAKINERLTESLIKRGINFQETLLRNVTLSDTLSQSIEDKLTAQQEAEKLDFLLERERKEAERKVIEAQGQRDSQRIINESLTEEYLYYLFINNLQNHEGTIYVPTEGGLPLIKDIDNND